MLRYFKGTYKICQGFCRNKICSKLLVEGMFALHFFGQSTHCSDTMGGDLLKVANMLVCLGLIYPQIT